MVVNPDVRTTSGHHYNQTIMAGMVIEILAVATGPAIVSIVGFKSLVECNTCTAEVLFDTKV